jgi:hypothetical protein
MQVMDIVVRLSMRVNPFERCMILSLDYFGGIMLMAAHQKDQAVDLIRVLNFQYKTNL